MKARIRWFNSISGIGTVRTEEGITYPLFFTDIEGINKNNHHYPSNEDQVKLSNIKNQECIIKLVNNQVVSLTLTKESK